MELISLGKVTVHLREPHDFSWLLELGEPFAVFDQNDSGNISFGVEKDGEKYFVKYAGASPENAAWTPRQAIAALRRVGALYEDLRHPALIEQVTTLETPQGFARVFKWVDGQCLHPHWEFDQRPKYTHPLSPYVRFRGLPLSKKRAAAQRLFDFLALVQAKGYLPVDLYDSSLLYDFETDTLTVCDIDLFEKGDFLINDKGKSWFGSQRFKAPEENELGACVDRRAAVYTLGKLLLLFFAGEEHPDRAHWEETPARWDAVQKAVSPDKADRFPTVAAFRQAWMDGGDALSVAEVRSPAEKMQIARDILEALPHWFGDPAGREGYIRDSADAAFGAAFEDGAALGFIALQETSPCAMEVAVMGVLAEHHRRGVGRALMAWAEDFARARGMRFLHLKTLDESAHYPPYDGTRAFYAAMGFHPLACLPTLWDAENPCLLMVKPL